MREKVDVAFLKVSEAAKLANMHPQTLRQYDRLGLVTAKRSVGKGRLYTLRDVGKLLEIQRLSQNYGINLIGIKRILELEDENYQLRNQLRAKTEGRIYEADANGILSALHSDYVRSRMRQTPANFTYTRQIVYRN
ncbi:MAG: MerR family transcriptional regulator [Bifidobacteriaceae bacterium]|nr:MerR family transcriptional regulator [Bifidobacteriaceae bacterium]